MWYVSCICFPLPLLQTGIIHSDLNEFNVTINSLSNARECQNEREQSNRNERGLRSAFGFFDFEHCHPGYAVFDVAVLMAYSALFLFRENSG